jgi:hypothetical protein
MNAAGLVQGLLLAVKRVVQWHTDFAPARWGNVRRPWLTRSVFVLTLLVPAWCLLSAINARADFDAGTMQFDYRERYLSWLPHSYDGVSTWFAFWQVLGLWCAFWALRDWLLGKTRREQISSQGDDPVNNGQSALPLNPMGRGPVETVQPFPARLQRLLWVLSINGAILALEGTLQRLSGTNRLLWTVETRRRPTSGSQFGPYAYQGNAAQYLNMLWPVCLGFALHIQRRSSLSGQHRLGSSPDVVLFLACALMMSPPLTMGARGGTLVALGQLGGAVAMILVGMRHHLHRRILIPVGLITLVVATGGAMGWKVIGRRLLQPADTFTLPKPLSLDRFTLRCVLDVPARNVPRDVYLLGLRSRACDQGLEGGQLLFQLRADGDLAGRFEYRSASGRSIVWVIVPGFQARFGGQRVDLHISIGLGVTLYANSVPLSYSMQPVPPAGIQQGYAVDYLQVFRQGPNVSYGLPSVEHASVFDSALSAGRLPSPANLPLASDAETFPVPILDLGPRQLRRPALWAALTGDQSTMIVATSGRNEIYATARRMAQDFVWLGSGPGTFGPLYGLYRRARTEGWAWYAHSDWLETRITWGCIGFCIVAVALAGVATLWWKGEGVLAAPPLRGLIGVAMAGCLAHALVDFPFQIHSVAHLFCSLACLGSVFRSAQGLGSSPRTA